MGLGLKYHGKIKVAWLVLILFLFGLLGLVTPDMSMAKTDTSNPATEITVVLNDNGIAFELGTYTIDQLKSMPQVEREYSSIDSMPAPVFTAGKGLDLEAFLISQGIDMNSVTHLRFYSTDNAIKRLSKSVLFDDNSYYFPKIKECWDTSWDENSSRYTDLEKVMEGATPVKPMLAITSSQDRFLPKPDWSSLDESMCPRLCMGQASPEEIVTMNFVRWVNKIEVFGKLQPGGSSSVAAPKVTLDKPAAGSSYQLGDTVKIEGTVEKLSKVTLTVTDPDGHSVFTVFDLDVKDGSFSEEFPLGLDLVTGSYTIETGPAPGSSLNCKQTFNVTAAPVSAASIILNTPEPEHTFQSQEKVIISGTVRGLTSASLKIVDPTKKTVHSGSIDKSGDFTEEFTLDKDALPGEYSIQITAPGLDKDYTRAFKVAKSDKSIPETKPETVAQPGPATSSLNDISNHWAAGQINKLVTRAAIKGYPDGSFKPDATITRAEFTTVVVKAFNLNNTGGKIFSDTSAHWAKDYIATATAAGIVGGYNDSTFGSNDPITREQMAAIVVKAAGLTAAATENNFSDNSSIAEWARSSVATAVNNQVIKGYPGNTFKPKGKATRAEAVTVIVNALKL
ncbi:MAG: S-layer homology domain-containing protein [Syntrophomonas sp.]|nr:S-layer homology domain-containing protein [Syntrophomonas sp.]